MDIDKELEDIFSDPLMDVSYQEAKLFDVPADMKGVMAQKKDVPDHVAQRKLCENFAQFKLLFEQVHQDLKTGKRQLQRISKTTSLLAGRYYLVDGQMVLLYEIIEKKRVLMVCPMAEPAVSMKWYGVGYLSPDTSQECGGKWLCHHRNFGGNRCPFLQS